MKIYKRLLAQIMIAFMIISILPAIQITPAFATIFSVTNGNDSGPGSLRQAVLDAAADAGTDQVINISPDVNTIISTTAISWSVAKSLTINGWVNNGAPGVTVTITGADQFFTTPATTVMSVTFNDIKVQNANNTKLGGAIGTGNKTTLTVNRCVFQNNAAKEGGAIAFDYISCISDSSFIGNSSTDLGGAVRGKLGNHGSYIKNSYFYNNQTGKQGGAVYAFAAYKFNVYNTSFVNNRTTIAGATNGGAALAYGGLSYMTCVNSTFYNNSVADGSGYKGAYATLYSGGGHQFANCTIVNNPAGGLYGGSANNAFSVYNSIIVGNGDSTSGAQVNLALSASNATNVIQYDENTNTYAQVFGTNSIISDKYLIPDSNGYACVALPITAAPTANYPSDFMTVLASDYLGNARSVTAGGIVTAGAIEVAPAYTGTVVKSEGHTGTGSIRAAMYYAKSGDTITFEPNVKRIVVPYEFTSALPLTFTGNVNADGTPGVIIKAVKTRLFNFTGALANTVTMNNIKFIDGEVGGYGGAILTKQSIVVNNCYFDNNVVSTTNIGGAICTNLANATIQARNCKFTRNSAYRGGALFSNGQLLLVNCSFVGNSTTTDAGSAVSTTGSNLASIIAVNCSFINNSNTSTGKYVIHAGYSNSNIYLSHCTVVNNACNGSAVYASGTATTRLNIYNSIILGNGDGSLVAQLGNYNGDTTITGGGSNIIQQDADTNNFAQTFGSAALEDNDYISVPFGSKAMMTAAMTANPTSVPTDYMDIIKKDINGVIRPLDYPCYGSVQGVYNHNDTAFKNSSDSLITDVTADSVNIDKLAVNTGSQSQQYLLVAAMYNTAGEMIACVSSPPITVDAGKQAILSCTLNTSARSEGCYIKTFLFDGISTVKPFAKVVSFPTI